MNIAAIILAAGASRRLGRPKQTVILGGETLVERAVRVAIEAGFSSVIVLVRPGADFAEALVAKGALILENPDAEEGMASSIRCGVSAAQTLGVQGVVVMTCDQIAVTPSHLVDLCVDRNSMAGSGYAGRNGIPAYFPSDSFGDLLQLHGDTGARSLLLHAHSVPTEALNLDIDTEEDLARALAFQMFEDLAAF